MRKITVCTCVFLTLCYSGLCQSVFTGHAAFEMNDLVQNLRSFVQPSEKNIKIPDRYKKYYRLRNHGIGLTAFGVACAGVGLGMIINANNNWDYSDMHYANENKIVQKVFGHLGLAGGGMAISGGLAMWIIADKKLKKFRNTSFRVAPDALGLTYYF